MTLSDRHLKGHSSHCIEKSLKGWRPEQRDLLGGYCNNPREVIICLEQNDSSQGGQFINVF